MKFHEALSLVSNHMINVLFQSAAVSHNKNVMALKDFLLSKSYLSCTFHPEFELRHDKVYHPTSNKVAEKKQSDNLTSFVFCRTRTSESHIEKCQNVQTYILRKRNF